MENTMYNINIERALLSSIIFEPQSIEEIQTTLSTKDFYLPFHQYLYDAMIRLNHNGMPIDEDFIKTQLIKSVKWDEESMLNVLSANPISNISAYIGTIKDYSLKRTLNLRIRNALSIESPYETLEELENIIEHNEKIDDSYFDDEDINEIEEKEPEFILEDWLPFPKFALSMIVGKGGDGKSFILLQAMIRYLRLNPGKKVLGWLSEDTKGITKFRAARIAKEILHTEIEEIKGLYIIGSDSKSQPFHIVGGEKTMKISEKWHKFKQKYADYDLIIMDPLIAFFGGDENNNSQARVFTTLLNAWASEKEKTIIIVHHTAKGKDDITNRGAGAFRDAVRLNYTVEPDPDNDQHRLIGLEKDNWGIKHKLDMDENKKVSRKIFPRALNIPVIQQNKDGVPTEAFRYQG